MGKQYALGLISALFLCASCGDEKGMVNATIVNTGDITNEGCGYLLKREDNELVLANNLPSAYFHDGLRVKVKYTHTGVMDTCKYGSVIYDIATIQKIKRRND